MVLTAMRKYWTRLLLCCFLAGMVFIPVWGGRVVQAAEPFTTSLNVTYIVTPEETTNVRYEIRLKNNTSTVYAKEYALQINSPDVGSPKAFDANGETLPFAITQTSQSTTISLNLAHQRVVGRDQEQLFTIEYTSKDMASIYGQVLEVTVPKLAEPGKYSQYHVLIMVPKTFGDPSIVEPNQYTLDNDEHFQILRFTNVGKENGISVLFGSQQSYGLTLQYHVINSAQNTGVVQVALPPDTPFQRLYYSEITPQPESLHHDVDGNWIAEFRVAGQAQVDILAKAIATLYVKPQVPAPVVNPLQVPEEGGWRKTESPYLKSQHFWPVENNVIQKIVSENKTPKEIYHYTVDTLQYNYERVKTEQALQRFGAITALQDPANAMCQEYTDVFVTVARGAGVPARRVTGYAVTRNSRLRPLSLVADVLHAWPEYFDTQRNMWIPVDPTWADTTGGVDYFSKLDLRHITFAIQGQNDDLPLPAGLYKISGQESKDVEVELLDSPPDEVEKPLTIEKLPSFLPRWGVPTTEKIRLTNPGGGARYNMQVGLGIDGEIDVLNEKLITIPVLLPYQTKEITVQLSGQDWLRPTTGTLHILIDDQDTAYPITARRAVEHPLVQALVLGGSFALFSAGAGSILVFGSRWYRAVRR